VWDIYNILKQFKWNLEQRKKVTLHAQIRGIRKNKFMGIKSINILGTHPWATYSYMLEQGPTMLIGTTLVHLDLYFSTIFSKNIFEIYSIHHLEKKIQNFINIVMLRFTLKICWTYVILKHSNCVLCVFMFNYCLKTLIT